MAALGWLLNLGFAGSGGAAPIAASGISGGSNNPHAIRARNWARINAGRVSDSDVNVVLQGIEDEEIITIIYSFLKSIG